VTSKCSAFVFVIYLLIARFTMQYVYLEDTQLHASKEFHHFNVTPQADVHVLSCAAICCRPIALVWPQLVLINLYLCFQGQLCASQRLHRRNRKPGNGRRQCSRNKIHCC